MFRNRIFIILCFQLINYWLIGQINFKEICALNSNIREASGLCFDRQRNSFWFINDSDNKPLIFEVDSQCNLLRTLEIPNANKKDWEEITIDKEGNLYIGDFGNNDNLRKDQKILKIKRPDLEASDKPEAQIIEFNYNGQISFPPASTELNFDMEAMIWMDNMLHLFSKNRTSPYSGFTYHYVIPDTIGRYSIDYIDSFYTGPGPSLLFWVTAAALSPDENQLCLLTHDKIWLFYPLDKKNFFKSPVRNISLGHFSQKEGVSYSDNQTLYFTDEVNSTLGNGGKLYRSSLENILSNKNLSIFYKPSGIQYVKEFIELELGPLDIIEILNTEGRSIIRRNGGLDSRINVSNLSRGLYCLISSSDKIFKRILFFKE